MSIDRREALKRTALIMGGALSAPSVLGVLNGCSSRPELNWTPTFFTEEQAMLVMEVSEGIIPKTATPGAKGVGVPGFIEEMVSQIYREEQRSRFIEGLQAFDEECLQLMGDKFVDLKQEKRDGFLQKKNQEIYKKSFPKKERPFFWMIKELTLLGYFTSEVGATQVLQYKAIPVEYNGCITVQEAGGRTWAT